MAPVLRTVKVLRSSGLVGPLFWLKSTGASSLLSLPMTSEVVAETTAGIRVDGEGSAAARGRAMNGTEAMPPVSRSVRRLEVPVVQDLFHADLRAEHVEINARHVHIPRLGGAVKWYREEAPVLMHLKGTVSEFIAGRGQAALPVPGRLHL